MDLHTLQTRMRLLSRGNGQYHVTWMRDYPYQNFEIWVSGHTEAYDRINSDIPERAFGDGGYTLKQAYMVFYKTISRCYDFRKLKRR